MSRWPGAHGGTCPTLQQSQLSSPAHLGPPPAQTWWSHRAGQAERRKREWWSWRWFKPPSDANGSSSVEVYEKKLPGNKFILIQPEVIRQESTTMSTTRTEIRLNLHSVNKSMWGKSDSYINIRLAISSPTVIQLFFEAGITRSRGRQKKEKKKIPCCSRAWQV